MKKQETIKKCYRLCTGVYQKLRVDYDGKVTCCCENFDNFLQMGDINKDTLYDIWNNSKEPKKLENCLIKNYTTV